MSFASPTSPVLNIPHQSAILLTISEPTLTHYYHSKPRVYIRFYSWGTFYGFWRMRNDMHPHFSIIQSSVSGLKILCASPIHSSLPPSPGSHCPFYCHSFSFSRMSMIGIIHYVIFSGWLLALNNIQLRFFHVFSRLDSSFVFSLK